MLHHSENKTTIGKGQSIATVICDTYSEDTGSRITTLELVYPRYIHSELMTHRMFSRNASSSRATPLSVTLEEVKNDPVFFDYVGKNQSGMVAGEALKPEELDAFREEWETLAYQVASRVEYMSERFGIHKQTLNRALEPFLRIRTLVTATEWNNFFTLRLAPDAQPEIRTLAEAMRDSMAISKPNLGDYHLPYIEDYNPNSADDWGRYHKISVARCARVSYGRLDGKANSKEEDIALFARLKAGGHLSPFEHAAYTLDGRHANFNGWQSLRGLLNNDDR